MKPSLNVTVDFGGEATGAGYFVLGASLLDGVDVLGGIIAESIAVDVRQMSFSRGRTAQIFDSIDAGTGVVSLNNHGRQYDPLHVSGPHYGSFNPGRRVTVTANGIPIFVGYVSDWDINYEVSGQATADLKFEDALAVLGRQQFDAWTATAGQTAGPRLTSILNRSEVAWPGGTRSIETGVSTLQGDVVSWGSSVLNYCQLVARSDLGAFFAARDGVLTFYDRSHNAGATPAVAFTDTMWTGIPFSGIGISFGSETYFTRVSVDREGGIAQTVEVGSALDGIRSMAVTGLLLTSDLDSLRMATYLAQTYSTGEPRVSSLEVMVDDALMSTDQVSALLRLDVGSLVSVTFTPRGIGSAIVQVCVVQGISHDVTPETHVVVLALGALANRSAFILNDPVMGVLNGPGVLAF